MLRLLLKPEEQDKFRFVSFLDLLAKAYLTKPLTTFGKTFVRRSTEVQPIMFVIALARGGFLLQSTYPNRVIGLITPKSTSTRTQYTLYTEPIRSTRVL